MEDDISCLFHIPAEQSVLMSILEIVSLNGMWSSKSLLIMKLKVEMPLLASALRSSAVLLSYFSPYFQRSK